LFVSNEEAALFRARLLPQDRLECDVRALRNGIDAALFDPAGSKPAPAMLAASSPRLIFTGQMDYAPNVAAARRAIERLLPIIRKSCPAASFHVVGRNPPEVLTSFHGNDNVFIHGAVDDMRSYLAAADLALVPLELARGVQNKVLEAMAMELPVVLTPEAATGIGGTDGKHYAVAESDEALAQCVIELIGDEQRRKSIALAARRFVIESLSWPATLAPLAGMLGLAEAAARDAA
jgi:glycosyltransferase involved in cell wall biosynthesis